jgi:phage terminase small subunit
VSAKTKPKGKKKTIRTTNGLTNQMRVFVESYLVCWNASEAARRAGYKSKPNVQGARLLANVSIQALIAERLSKMAMDADEVLARLSDHARGDLSPFMTRTGLIDLTTDDARAKLHLLKKAKVKKRVGGSDENPWTEAETEIELHDPQAALVQLGRHHGLFVDKFEVEEPILVKMDR